MMFADLVLLVFGGLVIPVLITLRAIFLDSASSPIRPAPFAPDFLLSRWVGVIDRALMDVAVKIGITCPITEWIFR
jgi:hypothetical protein